jgi:hypothetical protein
VSALGTLFVSGASAAEQIAPTAIANIHLKKNMRLSIVVQHSTAKAEQLFRRIPRSIVTELRHDLKSAD